VVITAGSDEAESEHVAVAAIMLLVSPAPLLLERQR
jgi:hypothetical protein